MTANSPQKLTQTAKRTDGQGRVIAAEQVSSAQRGSVLIIQQTLAVAPVKLIEITGYNSATALRYVQLFDLNRPAVNTDVPVLIIPAPAATASSKGTYYWGFEWEFVNGLVVASSTTEVSLTLTGVADLFYAAHLETAI